jgi:small subunit ribosomal protein S6
LNEYELLYIVSPRLAAAEVEQTVAAVSAAVQQDGGEVLAVDTWGRRRLAYPIRHHFDGTYVHAKLRIEPDQASRLERSLNIREDVLRHLLTRGIVEGIQGPPELELVREYSRRGPPPPFARAPEPAPEPESAPEPEAAAPEAAEPAGDDAEALSPAVAAEE